jgi:hypothetical protein
MKRMGLASSKFTWTILVVFAFLFVQFSSAAPAMADDGPDDEPPDEIRQTVTFVDGETPQFDHNGIEKSTAPQEETAPQQPEEGLPQREPNDGASDMPEVEGAGSQWRTLYFTGFESASINTSPGWSISENGAATACWGESYIFGAHAGNWSAYATSGCGGNSPGTNYPNSVSTTATYGPFSLANVSDARLEFWYNSNTETAFDHFCYGISDDGVTFVNECVSGNSGGFRQEVVSLKDYAGDSSVWIDFYFFSDSSVTAPGTWIDDIHILYSQTATFTSNKKQDGWVLESTETSDKGGTKNNTEKYLRVGDDASDRQYRSIVSFNTAALPDGATITNAILKLRQHSFVGNNVFDSPTLDIKNGTFGKAGLALTDFQAAASMTFVRTGFVFNEGGGWYSFTLTSIGRANINKTGITQLRIRLPSDDNDDRAADYFRYYSANSTSAPKLILQYTVP